MNLGELRLSANDFCGQSDTNYHASPAEVNRYLNEAMRRIAQRVESKKLNFFSSSALLNEVAGADEINLPTSTYRVIRLERVIGSSASLTTPLPMYRIPAGNDSVYQAHDGPHRGVVNREPMNFTMAGQARIRLIPAPSTSRTGSIRIHYIFKPADMTSDTHVPFQETAGTGGAGYDDLTEYHDIIWKMAAQIMLAKENAGDDYSLLADQTNQRIVELEDYLAHIEMGPRFVQVPIQDQDFFDC